MKKLGWWGLGGGVVILLAAIVTAGQMGETSHAFARGSVVIGEELVASARGVQTLFIIATGPDRPMPLGAFRKTLGTDAQGEFYEFVLTKDNMQRMMGDEPWPDTFKLKARLDVDGTAGPDQPGDLVGEVYPVRLGDEGVTIKINRLIAP
ncbi:MAG: hypothetical protein FJ146_01890 [Deltaproteobacteria bacterium]|nr:hypothetical protein [Deltaproteobacteria bacterium]